MSDINNSLVGFLKKKSLFSESPGKTLKFRERSKGKKNLVQTSKSFSNNPEALMNSKSSQNLHINKQFLTKQYAEEAQSQVDHKSLIYERPNRFYQTQFKQPIAKRNFNFKVSNDSKSYKNLREQENTNVWTGLVNHINSFQSAKIQSSQCLQSMSMKIHTELSNIDYKLDVFHSKMTQILNREFTNMKQKIYQIVNKVFEESQYNIRMYIKEQERILAKQLLEMKDALTKEYQKIQIMKQEITKPSWKKVAGELLSTQLEEKVDNMLYRSRSIDIVHWEIGDLGLGKISTLQNDLRDMTKLNTTTPSFKK